MIETHGAFSRTFWSPLDSVIGQPFRNAPWTGDLSGAAGFIWPCGGHARPVTRIHSLGHLCDILNVVTISSRSWVLASLLLLSASPSQHLIVWLSTMHRPRGTKKDTLGASFWARSPRVPRYMHLDIFSRSHFSLGFILSGENKEMKNLSIVVSQLLFLSHNPSGQRLNWSTSSFLAQSSLTSPPLSSFSIEEGLLFLEFERNYNLKRNLKIWVGQSWLSIKDE